MALKTSNHAGRDIEVLRDRSRAVKVNTKFSAWEKLRNRGGLSEKVYRALKYGYGVTSMAQFAHDAVWLYIEIGHRAGFYGEKERDTAQDLWVECRKELNLPNVMPWARTLKWHKEAVDSFIPSASAINHYDSEGYLRGLRVAGEQVFNYMAQAEDSAEIFRKGPDMTTEPQIRVNAERNEMIALLQHAKGAKFVKVTSQSSRLYETDSEVTGRTGPSLVYKDTQGLDLKVGDTVLVQYRERLGIGKVVHVLDDVPTSDEYDWSIPLKHVVSKIDVDLPKRLALMDRNMLKTITQSEAHDRLERLTRQLGIAMDQVTLELPSLDEESK